MALFSKPFLGVAGNGVEAPRLLAGFGIVCSDVAANGILSTRITDEHLSFGNARSHCDRVGLIRRRGLNAPHFRAGLCINRDESSVEHGNVNLVFVHREAANHIAAADSWSRNRAINLRVVAPQLLAGAGIDGISDAPLRHAVKDAVGNKRCGFLISASAEPDFISPGKTKSADIAGIDLFEQAVALFLLIQAIAHPVLAVVTLACIFQSFVVDLAILQTDGYPAGEQYADDRKKKPLRLLFHFVLRLFDGDPASSGYLVTSRTTPLPMPN
jgi:hypothetical protein